MGSDSRGQRRSRFSDTTSASNGSTSVDRSIGRELGESVDFDSRHTLFDASGPSGMERPDGDSEVDDRESGAGSSADHILRFAEPGDLKAVLELIQLMNIEVSKTNPCSHFGEEGFSDLASAMPTMIESASSIFLVAEIQRMLVGIFWAQRKLGRLWLVCGLYVLPQMRRRHIAQYLVRVGFQQMRLKGGRVAEWATHSDAVLAGMELFGHLEPAGSVFRVPL